MNSAPNSCRRRSSRRGFSLLELLGVMAIMAFLLAVTVPSIEGLNMGAGLSQGGQVFSDEVSLARQLSSARNITVQVRCINLPVRSQNGYTALQLWSVGTTPAPLSRLVTLPDGIVISQDSTKISTLFATYPLTGTMPTGSPVNGKTYVAFNVAPSGMVGPLATSGTEPSMSAASVGVVPAAKGAESDATKLPNYVLIQLNPLTAATIVYRP